MTDQYNRRIGTLPNIPQYYQSPPGFQQDVGQVRAMMAGGYGNPYAQNMPAFGQPFVQGMAASVPMQYQDADAVLNTLQQDFHRRAPRLQTDDFFQRVVSPIAGGYLGMSDPGALKYADAQQADVYGQLQDLRQFGGQVIDRRRALMGDAYKMAQENDPYSVENNYRAVQQGVALDRAQSYAAQVAAQQEAARLRNDNANALLEIRKGELQRKQDWDEIKALLEGKKANRLQQQGDTKLGIMQQKADTTAKDVASKVDDRKEGRKIQQQNANTGATNARTAIDRLKVGVQQFNAQQENRANEQRTQTTYDKNGKAQLSHPSLPAPKLVLSPAEEKQAADAVQKLEGMDRSAKIIYFRSLPGNIQKAVSAAMRHGG